MNYVTGFSERQFIVKAMFADGDKLVKYWQFKGKHTGNFFGIPATGKKVDVIGCTIAKMKDGKIAEEQDFMDNMVFMQQLGLCLFFNIGRRSYSFPSFKGIDEL